MKSDYAKLADCIKRLLQGVREFAEPHEILGWEGDAEILDESDCAGVSVSAIMFDDALERIKDAVSEGRRLCTELPDDDAVRSSHAAIIRCWGYFEGWIGLLETDDPELAIDRSEAAPHLVQAANEALADCGIALDRLWPELMVRADRGTVPKMGEAAGDDIDEWGEFRHENNLLTTAYIEERFGVRGPALSRDKLARENRRPNPGGRGHVYLRRDVLDLAERLAR